MEVYVLMALQFCDGEDLMSLYWSTWTVLQLGSLVVIAGVLLSVYNNRHGNKNPYVSQPSSFSIMKCATKDGLFDKSII